MVADHLGTTHHVINLTEDEMFNGIEDTIK